MRITSPEIMAAGQIVIVKMTGIVGGRCSTVWKEWSWISYLIILLFSISVKTTEPRDDGEEMLGGRDVK